MNTDQDIAVSQDDSSRTDWRIVETVGTSAKSVIHRVSRSGGDTVLVKTAREGASRQADASSYRAEKELLDAIDSPRVIRCLGVEPFADLPALVMHDVGGRSLRQLAARTPLSPQTALMYASAIADGLNDIHAAHVIHKDISPDNIFINPQNLKVNIIGFGLATMLPREQQSIVNPGILSGTLAYMSPEQTGRMNRVIDYRSDFYSFGATLYEMLTGRPPFVADDPLDLVHLHLAKQPEPLRELDPRIPAALCEIVAKLLSKNAEDRYQSAWGIKADLDECLKQLDAHGDVPVFQLGRADIPHHLQVPQRLYGREKKTALLLEKFDKVARGGREIMLIGGYSGIGKTSLVREVYKPITQSHGYFISGKFDQFQRTTPFRAWIDALRDFVKHLLTEDEVHLARWKSELLGALRGNGQLIVDVVPEIELIIGPQPALPSVDPIQTQNRINLVYRDFIQVIAQASHPLVVFLDDLQWIDSASLKFLTYLLKDDSIKHLMVIGAYRNNEVHPTHPLMEALQSLRDAHLTVDTIILEPLRVEHVRQLLADALYCHPTEAQALAELMVNKTDGNPFFIDEFLKSIYADGLLTFNAKQGRWEWNIGQIQARGITDNVVDLMTAKLTRLPAATQRALSLAACLGNRFSVATLATVYGNTQAETAAALRPALLEGLIDPTESSANWALHAGEFDHSGAAAAQCRFTHDRVQQAAYGLIPEQERATLHHTVGKLLRHKISDADLDRHVFTIVSHLSQGAALIESEDELRDYARLVLKAADIARGSGAYDTALGLIKIAISRLGAGSWDSCYELTLRLHSAGALAASLAGDMHEMNELARAATRKARSVEECVVLYEIRIDAAIRLGQLAEAITLAREGLRLLGMKIPAKPTWLHVQYHLWRTRWALLGKSDEDLLRSSGEPNPRAQLLRSLLAKIGAASYWYSPKLLLIELFESMRLGIQQTNKTSASGVYASYGYVLCSVFGRIEEGSRYGELAKRLVERSTSTADKVRNDVAANLNAQHWTKPLRELIPNSLEGYETCVQYGNFTWAANCLVSYCYVSFHAGRPLFELEKDFEKYNDIIQRRLRQTMPLLINALYHQATLALLDRNADQLPAGYASEEEMLQKWQAVNQNTALHTFHFIKQLMHYHFGRYEESVSASTRAQAYDGSIIGSPTIPVAAFYDTLARIALFPTVERSRQRKLLREIVANRAKLKKWARHGAANCLHKFLLVDAELARLRGNALVALERYEQAIAAARKHLYTQEEALANELAAKFHLARGSANAAVGHLQQALAGYQKWGAVAKVRLLRQAHGELLSQSRASRAEDSPHAMPHGALSADGFDMRALIKAVKGIAEEKVHSQLLERTILTAMEVAGAEAGVLILRKITDGVEEFFVEAEVALDKKPRILQSIPIDKAANVSSTVVNYVKRTQQQVVIDDALEPASEMIPGLHLETHVRTNKVKSILCIPLLSDEAKEGGGLTGLLYLENNQLNHAFDEQRIETLEVICLAAASRLELSQKAMIDGLTGLYNHETFQSLLQKEFSVSLRTGRPLSVIMVDIDRFKNFNDTWGHQVGDAVLKKVAATLRASSRESDIVARYGGEELVVILPDTPLALTQAVAERIRSDIEACELIEGGTPLKVTASLGLATLVPGMDKASALTGAADKAMYLSKQRGRNRVTAA